MKALWSWLSLGVVAGGCLVHGADVVDPLGSAGAVGIGGMGNSAGGSSGAESGATGQAGERAVAGAVGVSGSAGTDGTAAASGTAGGMAGAVGRGGGGAAGTNGAAGAAGRGGSAGTNGAAGAAGRGGSAGTNGAAGAAGRGGSAGTNGVAGAGGTLGTAGTGGRGGASGTGGVAGTVATGCNWVHAVNDTWSMNPAAADKIVLFDGTDVSQWHMLNAPNTPALWRVLPDKTLQVVPQATPVNIQSNLKFENLCVHVEYLTPIFNTAVADAQTHGNSGVLLKSAYEMQILDTSDNPLPLIDGCGSVYKFAAPLVVACFPSLTWNTYEIEFMSSVWDQSSPPVKIKDAAFVQVALNGSLVQKNLDLNPVGGFTQAGIPDAAGPQPLALQDHRDLVGFRNIWVTVPQY